MRLTIDFIEQFFNHNCYLRCSTAYSGHFKIRSEIRKVLNVAQSGYLQKLLCLEQTIESLEYVSFSA